MDAIVSPSAPPGAASIPERVEQVRYGFRSGATRDVGSRIALLERLRRFLIEQEDALSAALLDDLGKSQFEAHSTEIGFVLNEIEHAIDRIGAWTKPSRIGLPLHLRPGSARVAPEPLGTVLVIAPWNYPLHLALAPLVPALAAGNTAVIKPSELAPATSDALARLLPDYLDGSIVQIVTGDGDTAAALLGERFDHIFFTGSAAVGRSVLRAAADHLTPVTLELGGKSPAIVTSTADVAVSARRIAWGKCVNAGQTCVAPDYVLVDRRNHDAFVAALADTITGFFDGDPAGSPDYGRIISLDHVDRLAALLDAGGFETVAHGGRIDRETRFVEPTVVTGVDPDAPIMQEEIFGPILPVIAVDRLDEAIEFVDARPTPLAAYVFTTDAEERRMLVDRISAGGLTVNHTLLHLAVPDLPFGGVGGSGFGAYHGEVGFRTFSHHKPVLHRSIWPDPGLPYPPYTDLQRKLLGAILRRG